MENLRYLGTELDVNVEHELIAPNKQLGFSVAIRFKEDAGYGSCVEIDNNVTEVHHLYDDIFKEARIAFESDIHGTGITRKVSDIVSVEIVNALEVAESF